VYIQNKKILKLSIGRVKFSHFASHFRIDGGVTFWSSSDDERKLLNLILIMLLKNKCKKKTNNKNKVKTKLSIFTNNQSKKRVKTSFSPLKYYRIGLNQENRVALAKKSCLQLLIWENYRQFGGSKFRLNHSACDLSKRLVNVVSTVVYDDSAKVSQSAGSRVQRSQVLQRKGT
tara:strand:- start:891 stop:1412 length:522 start_codon:yes stop_codon:yes gene_type:complete